MFNAPTPPQPLQNQPVQSPSALPDVPVYAMPEKFTNPQSNNPQSSGGGGGGKKIFIIVIAVVVLLLVAGGAYAFLNYDKLFGLKETQNNQNILNSNTPPPQNTNTQVADNCGVSKSFLVDLNAFNGNMSVVGDSALECVGKKILNDCQASSSVLEVTGAGKIDFKVKGKKGSDCVLELKYGNASQITESAYKKYADKYIECSINAEEVKKLPDIKGSPITDPAKLAAGLYVAMGFSVAFGEPTSPQPSPMKCTGTLIQDSGNINSGGFGNLNQNANSAGNSNSANSNANANVNSSLNSNGNANAANSNINATSPLSPSKDTDEDGLTDSEEAVYQTNVSVKDTDGDSYYDGAEVASGFDPAKGSGAKLADSTAMKAYSNSSAGYSAFYPAGWAAGAAGEGGSDVMFTSTTGEFIQISIQENTARLPVLDWYLTQSPAIDQTKVSTIVINGKSAVLSPDNLNVYIGDGGRIIVLTYNPGTKTQISFGKTFQYIYQHLTITAPTQTNANANGNSNANANSNTNAANLNGANANAASANGNTNTANTNAANVNANGNANAR